LTEPGLVTLYDIWPGNGAGLFLQPPVPTWGQHITLPPLFTHDILIQLLSSQL